MKFHAMTLLLLLWPKHRRAARLAIAESIIDLLLRVIPDGPERIEFATFVASSRWFGDLLVPAQMREAAEAHTDAGR